MANYSESYPKNSIKALFHSVQWTKEGVLQLLYKGSWHAYPCHRPGNAAFSLTKI